MMDNSPRVSAASGSFNDNKFRRYAIVVLLFSAKILKNHTATIFSSGIISITKLNIMIILVILQAGIAPG